MNARHPELPHGPRRLPEPVFPELAEYMRMAWNGLSAASPAARRVEAAESARDLLSEAIALPLKEMNSDALVMAILQLRAGLARLLAATIPAAVPPAPSTGDVLDDTDLVAHLLDLFSDAAPLDADVAVHVGHPLPAPLIDTLAQAIHAPGLRPSGEYLEARGICGNSTIHLTAMTSGGA
ncbi:hypothetical protein GTY20_09085 [Streptomyces sp. SID4946]|uniref:hypothetical protein n=1 Tax=Streptomyces sp. LamerLS-31b TaxID=1839765 RepID=UPI00081F59CE|nr:MULTISPECIES: hypothetical protein [unclassified Streptomyces]MYQ91470.1 hypothetical protein [Streptomyces sp. SID4946]SCF67756.1 hypothetical protein GA0115256_111322 [Streptomyces sp. DconLS]SCF79507.1 hypothetical protein GA0115258_112584 [Streptomyces sp. LamerLS-31b]